MKASSRRIKRLFLARHGTEACAMVREEPSDRKQRLFMESDSTNGLQPVKSAVNYAAARNASANSSPTGWEKKRGKGPDGLLVQAFHGTSVLGFSVGLEHRGAGARSTCPGFPTPRSFVTHARTGTGKSPGSVRAAGPDGSLAGLPGAVQQAGRGFRAKIGSNVCPPAALQARGAFVLTDNQG